MFVFVLVYQGMKRRLDPARKLVAVMAFLDYVYGIVRLTSKEGRRFTHSTLYDKLGTPLFHMAGAGVDTGMIFDTLLLASVAYALWRYAAEQRRQGAVLEEELKSARELQRVLIPEALPSVPGYAVGSVYQPAHDVGGDFFQIIPLDDHSTLVLLGDVSGKGLHAAMNVSLIVGTVRTLAEAHRDPVSILLGLNHRLVGRLQGGFTTCLVLRVGRDGLCSIANAGHLAPFLNGTEIALDGSLPLGLIEEAEYHEDSFVLHERDRLTVQSICIFV
jgi:serine phosphatase RsbU (regulator of sigma subunit)